MMKMCLGCKIEKNIDEFNYKSKQEGVRQSQCKLCTRIQVRNHYYKKHRYYLHKAQKRNKEMRNAIRKYIWGYLQIHPCIDCGEKDIVVLTFDHRENKLGNISDMTKWRFGLSKLKQEIEKCDVRCANCHMRKTAKEFGWKKYGPVAQLD